MMTRKGNNEYLVKLAAIEEFKMALSYKREYDDLRDTFKGLVEELLLYARENRIDLPQLERFNRITQRAVRSVEAHLEFNKRFKAPPTKLKRFDSPTEDDNGTPPSYSTIVEKWNDVHYHMLLSRHQRGHLL